MATTMSTQRVVVDYSTASSRVAQRAIRQQRHRHQPTPSADWTQRALRALCTRMTAAGVSDDESADSVDADLLALLALVAPRALLDRLVVEAALNALKHASILAALRRVDDLFAADDDDDCRLARVLARVLATPSNATFFATPIARDSLVRFVTRLLDLQSASLGARPVVKGAVFEFLDETLFPANGEASSPSLAPLALLSWSEFVVDVALPVVAERQSSAATDVVFGVLLRSNALNNRIVDDPDAFVRLARAVGASLFDARSARAVAELDRRVALFNELLKLQAVRRAFTDDDALSGEAALRFSRVVSSHPHTPLTRAPLNESQCCVLAALCAGSSACARIDVNCVTADVAAMLDSLCALDVRSVTTLFGGAVLPGALQLWLSRRDSSDTDALSRCMYILNAWLRGASAATSDVCRVLLAVARFPPAQLARRECIAQLVVAIAERLSDDDDDDDDDGAIANPALRAALDATQLATIDAARARGKRR
jgi:hypothetical protein